MPTPRWPAVLLLLAATQLGGCTWVRKILHGDQTTAPPAATPVPTATAPANPCGGTTPHLVRGVCRECIDSGGCAAGMRCSDEGACVAGVTAAGFTVGLTCQDDSQCGEARCVDHRCLAPEAEVAGAAKPCTLEPILFAFDSYELDVAARAKLEANLACLREAKEAWVLLEGHTDQRGSPRVNSILATQRANAVRAALRDLAGQGLTVETVSFGKAYPVVPGEGLSESEYQLNRRVEWRRKGQKRTDGFLLSAVEGKTGG